MKPLTPEQLKRCAEILEVIVRPGDHDFFNEIEEAQKILGFYVPPPTRTRYQKKKGYWPTRGAGRMKPGWKAVQCEVKK